MSSIKMVGITCNKCDCYYFTIAKSHKSKCPKCDYELELFVCEKRVCIGCDKTNICSMYRGGMEDISGL